MNSQRAASSLLGHWMPVAVLGLVGVLLLASAIALATRASGFDPSVAAVFATMVCAAVAFVVLAAWGGQEVKYDFFDSRAVI